MTTRKKKPGPNVELHRFLCELTDLIDDRIEQATAAGITRQLKHNKEIGRHTVLHWLLYMEVVEQADAARDLARELGQL